MLSTAVDLAAAAKSCLTLADIEQLIPTCEACSRLRAHCREVAQVRVRRFAASTYWGRPVPGFGDPAARILIVGLAPAAHGANRTGRMFTGDRSGDFLYAGLYRAGLATQKEAVHRDDGLRLHGVYISAAARCAPPQNRPTPQELAQCRPYLLRELDLLTDLRVVLALGAIGHETYLRARAQQGLDLRPSALKFRHAALHLVPGAPALLDCYHVSQQNTFTGRLTPAMLDEILLHAKEIAGLG